MGCIEELPALPKLEFGLLNRISSTPGVWDFTGSLSPGRLAWLAAIKLGLWDGRNAVRYGRFCRFYGSSDWFTGGLSVMAAGWSRAGSRMVSREIFLRGNWHEVEQ